MEESMGTRIRTLCVGLAALLLLAVMLRPAAAADDKPATGSGQGTIVYRGQPLPGGTIGFHPAKGKPVVVKIKADGSYSAPAVPVGAVKITIETTSVKPRPGGGKPAKYVPIPDKYATPETSGLTLTVQKGKQMHNIELK
jgi:hypothetical protein